MQKVSFLGLKHAAVFVKNIEAARHFYQEIFDFQDYYFKEASDWAMLKLGDTTLSLIRAQEIFHSQAEGAAHPMHLGIVVKEPSDVDAQWLRIKNSKYFEKVLLEKAHLHRDESYGFYLKDLDGNQLEVIYIPKVP